MVRGLPTSRKIFINDVKYDMDPLTARSKVTVTKLKHQKDFLLLRAEEVESDYEKGMFVKAELPYYMPQEFGPCFFSTRIDELLAIKLRAGNVQMSLTPDITDAFNSIPEYFDGEGSSQFWNDFFSLFPTHYTEAAYIGGKIEISSVTKQIVTNDKQARAGLDRILNVGTLEGSFVCWFVFFVLSPSYYFKRCEHCVCGKHLEPSANHWWK